MRFYFQDAGAKVATKCIRISSNLTAAAVVNTLIEKFRPDMKMLAMKDYYLYEVHAVGGNEETNMHVIIELSDVSRTAELILDNGSMNYEGSVQKQPVAHRHHMVSGSLALPP